MKTILQIQTYMAGVPTKTYIFVYLDLLVYLAASPVSVWRPCASSRGWQEAELAGQHGGQGSRVPF